jgi:hypothetical protein
VENYIKICKWYGNADSPVLFMIDDLANVWVDTNGNGKVDLGEDWGYAKNSENSSFKFLNEKILKDFPKVKATFFTPVGIRVGIIGNPTIKSVSKMINCDEETKAFFRNIHNDPRFEIAYHGTTHGRVGKTNRDFKQEWELFNSLEEAITAVSYGKEIYKDVFGQYPKGGKYCGYSSNIFSDDSIDKAGFLWWSRYWNKKAVEIKTSKISGGDSNPITNFDIKVFGENHVLDIPSTVRGSLLTGILNVKFNSIKSIIKFIFRKYLVYRKMGQIKYLIENKLIISIQEHIAPARDDGNRQIPNIFDDIKSLHFILNYLKRKNMWYCNATELAEYYYCRENSEIDINNNKFKIHFSNKKNISNKLITLFINDSFYQKVKTPDNMIFDIKSSIVSIPILSGEYELLI